MARASRFSSGVQGLHIEADGCTINIYEGMVDPLGRKTTEIEVLPDKAIPGVQRWKLVGQSNTRVVQLKDEHPVRFGFSRRGRRR